MIGARLARTASWLVAIAAVVFAAPAAAQTNAAPGAGPRATSANDAYNDPRKLELVLVWLWREKRLDEATKIAGRLVELPELAGSPIVVGDVLFLLASRRTAVGDANAGFLFYERSCLVYDRAVPRDEAKLALCLRELGLAYRDRSRYPEAKRALERALEIERRLGASEPDITRDLSNLATAYDESGDSARAEPIYKEVLAKLERRLGPTAPEVAAACSNLASHYMDVDAYASAEPLLERALAIREAIGAPRELAMALDSLARFQRATGAPATALATSQRALDLLEKSGRLETEDGAVVMTGLGAACQDTGDYRTAQKLYERSVGVWRNLLAGRDDPRLGDALNNLGDVLKEEGHYGEAEPLYRQALDMWTRVFGPDHPLVATGCNNLGALAKARGDYLLAEQWLNRAIAIDSKRGDASPELATDLNNLGAVFVDRGDYVRAEPYYAAALETWKRALGPASIKVGLGLNNLATLYVLRGDYRHAETLLNQAIGIAQAAGSTLDTARSQFNLAAAYDREESFGRAEVGYRKAIELYEAALGRDHPEIATVLNALAGVRVLKGDTSEAEGLLRRARSIAAASVGADSVECARYDAGLALVLDHQGQFAASEALYAHALAVYEKTFGDEHPDIAKLFASEGLLYWREHDGPRAVAAFRRGMDVRERHVAKVLAAGSEDQRRLWLATSADEVDWAISLHAQGFPADPSARSLAMLAVLRRKGRVIDAMADTTRTLRAHLSAGDAALLDDLKATRSEIARRAEGGPGAATSADDNRRALEALEQRADRTEAAIASRSAPFRVAAEPVTLEKVAARIPPDAALVEITRYVPFDPGAAFAASVGPPRYAAYTLRSDGQIAYADLGDAKAIEEAVTTLRRALGDPTSDPRAAARALDERTMRPIRALVGNARRLFLVPDGALDLVPFGALVDERGHYLVDDWSLRYLSTGRDFLRPLGEAPRTAPLVVANPDFGPLPSSGTPVGAFDLGMRFKPLDGTESEGRNVAASLPGSRLLRGAAASSQAIESIHGPEVLHIATHGFFLDDATPVAGRARDFVVRPLDDLGAVALPANPLLRTGLAFAGANLHRPGDSGLVTALEASSLDLQGTKLVVLSACDTGIGAVRSGEGVYGLRRAIALAGAESSVVSLWKVYDPATSDLMTDYYASLARGGGRADALRDAQLELRKNPKYAHPYYWASFVQSGEDGPLDASGGLPSPLPPGVGETIVARPIGPPSTASLGRARGCGCKTAGAPDSGERGASCAFALALVVGIARRRRAGERRREAPYGQ